VWRTILRQGCVGPLCAVLRVGCRGKQGNQLRWRCDAVWTAGSASFGGTVGVDLLVELPCLSSLEDGA